MSVGALVWQEAKCPIRLESLSTHPLIGSVRLEDPTEPSTADPTVEGELARYVSQMSVLSSCLVTEWSRGPGGVRIALRADRRR